MTQGKANNFVPTHYEQGWVKSSYSLGLTRSETRHFMCLHEDEENPIMAGKYGYILFDVLSNQYTAVVINKKLVNYLNLFFKPNTSESFAYKNTTYTQLNRGFATLFMNLLGVPKSLTLQKKLMRSIPI